MPSAGKTGYCARHLVISLAVICVTVAILAPTTQASTSSGFTESSAATGETVAITEVTESVFAGPLTTTQPQHSHVTLRPNTSTNGKTVTYAVTVHVDDDTGSGAGWREQLRQTPFRNSTNCALGRAEVTSVRIADAPDSTNTDVPTRHPVVTLPITLGNVFTSFLGAAPETGMGNFIVTTTVSVNVPANACPGPYTAAVTTRVLSDP